MATTMVDSADGKHIESKPDEVITGELNQNPASKSAADGATTDIGGRRFEKVGGNWVRAGDTPLASYGGVSDGPPQSFAYPGPMPAGGAIPRRHPNTYKQRVPDRIQKLGIGFLVWIFLAFWSMAAFLEHIETIYGNSEYIGMAKVGAFGAEVILLCLIILKCYNKHLRVRAAALVCAMLLGVFILLHSGTLRSTGAQEAQNKKSQEAYTGAAERIAKATTESVGTAAATAQAKMKAEGLSQRERMAAANNLRATTTTTAKELAAGMKAIIDEGDKKVYESSIFPTWYVQQWMYIAVFVFAMAMLGIVLVVWMFAGNDDVDENHDGIPDNQQPHLFPQYAQTYPVPYYPQYPPPYPGGYPQGK